MTEHTPGPWVVNVDKYGNELWLGGFDSGTFTIRTAEEKFQEVAWLGGSGYTDPESIANARTITRRTGPTGSAGGTYGTIDWQRHCC